MLIANTTGLSYPTLKKLNKYLDMFVKRNKKDSLSKSVKKVHIAKQRLCKEIFKILKINQIIDLLSKKLKMLYF